MTTPLVPAAGPARKKPSLASRAAAAVRRAVTGAERTAPTRKLPPSPFASWTYTEAQAAIEEVLERANLATITGTDEDTAEAPNAAGVITFPDPRRDLSVLEVNRRFFKGDHWQDGHGWVGPHPQSAEEGFSETMGEIALGFVSKNVVREVTKRHAHGVVGRFPRWSFVPRRAMAKDEKPTAAEQTKIDAATRLVQGWLDARKVPELLVRVICTALLCERADLRLLVPPGLLVDAQAAAGDVRPGKVVPEGTTIEQALAMIWPDHPDPEHAVVVEDEDTKLECGVRLFSMVPDTDEAGGATQVDADQEPIDVAELVYLQEDGTTVVRLVGDDEAADEPAVDEEYALNTGGRLLMHEVRRGLLITPQVQQAQRALNLALSMLPRNVITGGFLERVILNAQMPGEWEVDADGQKTGRFKPAPYFVGAGTTNWLTGVVVDGKDQAQQLSTPDVKWRDPVTVEPAIAAAMRHYLDILDEVGQLHVVLAGEATVSGKSREQARAEYETTLLETAPGAEAALRWLIETLMGTGEALAGKDGEFTEDLRVEVQARVNTGPLTPEERKANEESIGRTISQQTAMARNNVDDVEAEQARMAADPLARATLGKAQGDAIKSLTDAGAGITGAAEHIGISAADAKKLLGPGDGTAGFANPTDPKAAPPKPGTGGNNGAGGGGAGGGDRRPAPSPAGGRGDTKQGSGSGAGGGQ